MAVQKRRPKGRGATVLHGTSLLAIAAAVATFALAANPATPPSVAEFAPQATRQIEQAPEELGVVDSNVSPGGRFVVESEPESDRATEPQEGPSDEPDAGPVVGVPSSLQCVSWPDGSVTQTFDPQSPPCVATWPGIDEGNGGVTWPGVTDTEVRVSVAPTNLSEETWARLAAFFNSRYQLYGRRIVPVVRESLPANTPEGESADGRTVVASNVFASLDYNYYYNDIGGYARALADAGILYIRGSRSANFHTSSQVAARPDLVWGYYTEFDRRMRATGSFACATLAGRPPEFAGAETSLAPGRRFALLVPEPTAGAPRPDVSPLVEALAACGVEPEIRTYAQSDARGPGMKAPGPASVTMMSELRRSGATTLVPTSGDPGDLIHLMNAAERTQYQPEWLSSGRLRMPASLFRQEVPPTQALHYFGLEEASRTLPMTEQVWNRALIEMGDRTRYTGREAEYFHGHEAYAAMQLLAAGIQMAGPTLTPATFGDGLRSTRFPNPGVGMPSFFQQAISFGAGDFSEVDDWAVRWWSPVSDDINDRTPGTWCWLDGGRRFDEGRWPADFRFEPGASCP